MIPCRFCGATDYIAGAATGQDTWGDPLTRLSMRCTGCQKHAVNIHAGELFAQTLPPEEFWQLMVFAFEDFRWAICNLPLERLTISDGGTPCTQP